MPPASIPEAEPKETAEKPKEKIMEREKKIEKVMPVQKPEVVQKPEKSQGPDASSVAIWHLSSEAVRKPMQKVLKTGAFLALPPVGATLWLGDKLAQRTVSKVPKVGELYSVPRSALDAVGTKFVNVTASTITTPVLPLDIARDVAQGALGMVKEEHTKNALGRVVAKASEGLGTMLKWGYEKGSWLLGQTKEKGEKAIEATAKLLFGAARIPYDLTHGALDKAVSGTKFAMINGPVSFLTSAATLITLGAAGAWLYGGASAVQAYFGLFPKAIGYLKMAWYGLQGKMPIP